MNSELQPVSFFRDSKVKRLKKDIKRNLAYYREGGVVPFGDEDFHCMKTVQVDVACFEVLNMQARDEDDEKNAILVYEHLKRLTPQQAADGRIWSYLTHVQCLEYVRRRWPVPEDNKKAVAHIKSHYFVDGARGLVSRNAVARLWWMGWIATRCDDYSANEVLEVLLKYSDVRSSLLERPSLSRSVEIFVAVIRMLREHGEGVEGNGLYKRENFREFMKVLNRRGGRMVLNALPTQQLTKLLEDIVGGILQTKSS